MHTIEVPVTYKNKNLFFKATFLQAGYTYKFEVDVNGINIFFEPDEEQNYKFRINIYSLNKNGYPDSLLVPFNILYDVPTKAVGWQKVNLEKYKLYFSKPIIVSLELILPVLKIIKRPE